MAGADPEERVAVALVRMRWESVTFLHWPYPPSVVQRLLPDRLRADTWDGHAWVGVTPFVMAGVRPPLLPAVPRWSTFAETNVRTYVRDRTGRDGLWFLSLDCGRAGPLAARAAIGVPYAWSAMRVEDDGSTIRYTSRRHPPGNTRAASSIVVAPGAPLEPAELRPVDHFLTGRWRAFSRRLGTLFVTPVEHEPWPLQRADVLELRSSLIAATGLPAPDRDPIVHHAPRVHVRIGPPRPVA